MVPSWMPLASSWRRVQETLELVETSEKEEQGSLDCEQKMFVGSCV